MPSRRGKDQRWAIGSPSNLTALQAVCAALK
jgi:hypothetical protein